MSDPLRATLVAEADARSAYETIPDVGDVHRRAAGLPAPRPGGQLLRRAAPAAAAAVVVLVAIGTYLLHPGGSRAETVAVPSPPSLGSIVPPLVVRQRLGAPPGHLNGPAVAEADALAVSGVSRDGLRLHTVGVVRQHATPDAQGRPRLDRCVYTYSTPRPDVLSGRCDWAMPSSPATPDTPMTLEILGPPGHTWLSGTAPHGTAAVVLRSHGRKQLVVATGDAGTAWGGRPYYATWWPRIGTDIIAVDRAGHELTRTRLPSDTAVRRSASDPELGTMELPLRGWSQLSTPRHPVPTPSRVDLLARTKLSDLVSVLMYGAVHGDEACIVQMVRDLRGQTPTLGGSSSCMILTLPPGSPLPDPISVGRSYSAGTGEPQEQLLSGSAPRGTARIRLSTGGRTQTYAAYDSGERWHHRAYFIAAWPSAATTRVTALDRDGRPIASTVSKGLNPRAFDDDFLAAEARCLEDHGVKVTRLHPQGTSGTAYTYSTAGMSTDQARRLVDSCEAAADRAVR